MARKLLLAFAPVTLLVSTLLGGLGKSQVGEALPRGAQGRVPALAGDQPRKKTFSVPASRCLVIESGRGDVKVIAGGEVVEEEVVYSARGEAVAARRRRG